ncbi:hypothetical protein DPMN_025754 [Dreissena polymorpha]|uniref:Uncharacterized protein n=1 Tax=Dreissena polymorpha TaxID=45954 RepID=A0A9D4LRA7_DREPO|nr:hypothetical protein DPMN_025754 [Dreissena polymorpha]
MDICSICHECIDDSTPTARLDPKGCQTLLDINSKRGLQLKAAPGDIVHVQCRKDFTRPVKEQDISVTNNVIHILLEV